MVPGSASSVVIYRNSTQDRSPNRRCRFVDYRRRESFLFNLLIDEEETCNQDCKNENDCVWKSVGASVH